MMHRTLPEPRLRGQSSIGWGVRGRVSYNFWNTAARDKRDAQLTTLWWGNPAETGLGVTSTSTSTGDIITNNISHSLHAAFTLPLHCSTNLSLSSVNFSAAL